MEPKNTRKRPMRKRAKKGNRTTLTQSVSMPPHLLPLMDERCLAHVPPLKRSQYLCGLIINDLKDHGYIDN